MPKTPVTIRPHSTPTAQRPFSATAARIALSAPVIVDHDKERVVGRVLDLLTRYEDGEGTWLVARCEIDDRAPSWIKKGTPASFGYVITHNGGAATSSARSWVFAK